MSVESKSSMHLNIQDIRVLLPPFDPNKSGGMSASEWIETVEKERARHGWDEGSTLLYASVCLKEAVKSWFMDNVCGWPELKLRLLRDFPDPVGKLKVFTQMMRKRKKPTESFEDYIINVGRMARKCNLNMLTTIRCIVVGLEDEELKKYLVNCNCQTISEVLTQIRLFNGQQNHGDLDNRSHNSTKRSRMKFATNKSDHLNIDSIKSNDSHSGSSSNVLQNDACPTSDVVDDCKDLLKIVRVGSVHLTAFVDLASRCSTLRQSEVKKYKWKMQNCNTADLQISADVVGKLTEKVKVDDVEMVIDVVVVGDNAQDFPMVLGRNFLNNPGVCVLKTFHNLEIKYSKPQEEKALQEGQEDVLSADKCDEVDKEILEILECIERDCL